jgi:hypothetical protein
VSNDDHRDVDFQLGATVIVEMMIKTIQFKVSIAELLCKTKSDNLPEKIILELLKKRHEDCIQKMMNMLTCSNEKCHYWCPLS